MRRTPRSFDGHHGSVPNRNNRRPLGKLTAGAKELYTAPPSEQELAGTGLTPEDYEGEDFEVWPENWPAFSVFCQMSTQWRVGLNGPTGLDYNVLFKIMSRLGLPDDEYDVMFSDVRVMEVAALEAARADD